MKALKTGPRFFTPKRTFLAICIIVIGAAIAMIALGATKWPTMVSANQQMLERSTNLKEQVVQADSRDARVSSVRELAELQPAECEGQWWYEWQSAVSVLPAREQKQECERLYKKTVAYIEDAKPLARYLEGEQDIAEVLSTLAIDSKNKNWQEAAGVSAAAAQRSLNDIAPDSNLEIVHQTALKRVEAVVRGWTNLESASKKEDRVAYEKAQLELQDAYAELAEVTDISDEQLAQLLRPFVSQ